MMTPEETREVRRALGHWFYTQEIGFADAMIVICELAVDVLTLTAESRADFEAGREAFIRSLRCLAEERNADFTN